MKNTLSVMELVHVDNNCSGISVINRSYFMSGEGGTALDVKASLFLLGYVFHTL